MCPCVLAKLFPRLSACSSCQYRERLSWPFCTSFARCIILCALISLTVTLCSEVLPFFFFFSQLEGCKVAEEPVILLDWFLVTFALYCHSCTSALIGFKNLLVLQSSFALQHFSSRTSPAGSQGSLRSTVLNPLVFVLLFLPVPSWELRTLSFHDHCPQCFLTFVFSARYRHQSLE